MPKINVTLDKMVNLNELQFCFIYVNFINPFKKNKLPK